MPSALIAIDQGTTSTRAIAFDAALNPLAMAQIELRQIYPAPGHVEHVAEEIWNAVVATVRECLGKAKLAASDIGGIGITNQRETTVVWDRATGKPIHNAIVWQDRRTAPQCAELRAAGVEDTIRRKTGLVLDPYFSATKVAWLLDHIPGARARAERGELAFGTVDTWLAWQLSESRTHVTDPSNAASVLKIISFQRGTPTPSYTTLSWNSVPSRFYVVQKTPALVVGSWSDYLSQPVAGWNTVGFDDFNPTNDFFRVRAYRPLMP